MIRCSLFVYGNMSICFQWGRCFCHEECPCVLFILRLIAKANKSRQTKLSSIVDWVLFLGKASGKIKEDEEDGFNPFDNIKNPKYT